MSGLRRHHLLPLLALACATPARGPRDVAEAYAHALEQGRVDDAAALAALPADEAAAFRERYAQPQARDARAREVRAGLDALSARAPGLALTQTPEGWRVVEAAPEAEARAALGRFLDAADARRWDAVWAALHPQLQARYTPERLAQDFGREPQAPERLARARAALAGPVHWADGEARLPVGAGRAVRLARVDGAWRVVALE